MILLFEHKKITIEWRLRKNCLLFGKKAEEEITGSGEGEKREWLREITELLGKYKDGEE